MCLSRQKFAPQDNEWFFNWCYLSLTSIIPGNLFVNWFDNLWGTFCIIQNWRKYLAYFNFYKRSILPEVLKLTVACQQMTNNNNGDFYFKIEVLKSKPQGNKLIEIICLQYAIQD